MTEAQKSLKQQLKNCGLYVDDSTGTPVLKDAKGRVIGGGGSGQEVVVARLSYSSTSKVYVGDITAEQQQKLYNGGKLIAVLGGTDPEVTFVISEITTKANGECWGLNTFFGNMFATLWISANGHILVTPRYYAERSALGDYQKKITYGTGEPTGGQNGDVYFQLDV